MKSKLRFQLPFLLLLTFVFTLGRAAVPITGPLAPASASATYATHDAQYGKGGLTYWTNHTTVPTLRRAAGMIVFDTTSSNYWQLGTNLTTWTQAYLPATDVEGNLTTVSNTAVTITGNLTTVSNTAAAALPKAGGVAMSGLYTLSGNATAPLNPVPLQQLQASNAALQATLATLIPQPFQFTSSGLTLTVPTGSVTDAVGGIQTYSGGTLALIPNYTNHVYLINNQLIGFSRAIHRGGVYLGCAITGNSSVTAFKQPSQFSYFTTRIPRYLSMQVRGLPQLVWGVGDSITQGAQALGSQGFMNIMFNTTYAANGRNVLNAANVTMVNYGESGMPNAWGLAFTADIVAAPLTGVGQFFNTAMHRTRFNNAQFAVADQKRIGTPNHLKRAADLVLTGFGNSSGYNLDLSAAQLETEIQRLQDLGCEIVLHTEQPFYTGVGGSIGNWAILQDGARMAAIADARCCELADTFGAMQFLHDAGLEATYYVGDHVHPNTLGHDWWAMVLNSVISPGAGLTKTADANPPRRRSQYPTGTYSTGYGAGVEVQIEYSGTGVVGTDPQVSAYGAINLNTIATGASTSANAYLLTLGQKINVRHGGCTGLGVITGLDSGSTAVCHMQDQSGGTWGSSFTISGSFSDQITKIFQLGDFLGFTGGVGNWSEGANTPSRLPCYAIDMWLVVDSFTGNATTLPVVGFVIEGPIRKEIGDFKLVGTWSNDTSNGHENGVMTPYTDTAGSCAVIAYNTDVLEVWCIAGSQSGNIDVFVDGEQVLNNTKLASVNAGYIYHLFLQPGNSPNNHTAQAGYRTSRLTPHVASIRLRAPGSSPVAGNRSLQIIAVNGLNFE